MKKSYIPAIILSMLLIMSLAVLHASAAVPEEGAKTLEEVTGGKNVLKFPAFLDGGEGFNDTEGAESMFDYENESSKYCSDKMPYWAEWQYDKAYVVERIILRTANDNKSYPRRMGDGWTLSGSNDGKGWTVIYTGKEDDVVNLNFMYYYVDLPDNKDAYKYYKLNSDEKASDNKDNAIQLTMLILAVNESVEVPAEPPYVYKSKNLKLSADNVIIDAVDFDAGTYNETKGFTDGDHNVRADQEVQTSFCGADYAGREGLSGGDATCIGWTDAGEWVQYTISVIKSGVYQIDAWVASGADPAGSVELSLGDTVIGSAQATNSGWQNYSKVTVGTLEIQSGSQVFKALFPTGGINFHAIEFTRTGDIPTADTTAAEDKASADDDTANAGDTTATTKASASEDEGGSNVMLFVIIGIAVVAVIVIVIVLVTRKKK